MYNCMLQGGISVFQGNSGLEYTSTHTFDKNISMQEARQFFARIYVANESYRISGISVPTKYAFCNRIHLKVGYRFWYRSILFFVSPPCPCPPSWCAARWTPLPWGPRPPGSGAGVGPPWRGWSGGSQSGPGSARCGSRRWICWVDGSGFCKKRITIQYYIYLTPVYNNLADVRVSHTKM